MIFGNLPARALRLCSHHGCNIVSSRSSRFESALLHCCPAYLARRQRLGRQVGHDVPLILNCWDPLDSHFKNRFMNPDFSGPCRQGIALVAEAASRAVFSAPFVVVLSGSIQKGSLSDGVAFQIPGSRARPLRAIRTIPSHHQATLGNISKLVCGRNSAEVNSSI
jgi:hypothetical protein